MVKQPLPQRPPVIVFGICANREELAAGEAAVRRVRAWEGDRIGRTTIGIGTDVGSPPPLFLEERDSLVPFGGQIEIPVAQLV